MDYNFIIILLDLFITIIAYSIVPFILFYKAKKEYNKKEKKKILIFNSITVAIIFIIIRIIFNDVQPVKTFAPALLYYYINKLIWFKHSGKNIKYNKCKKRKKENLIIIVATIILIITILIFTTLLIKKEKIINNQKKEIKGLIMDNKSYQQENNNLTIKSSFIDNNIVFEIEELKGKYLSYNCMIYLTKEKKYSFLVYNKAQAQAKGLEEYKCSIRTELGIETN